MTRDHRREPTSPRDITRRTWLGGAVATTGAAVAATGLPGILAHAQAPAAPRGTRLHLLQWSHFVQAADVLFDQQAAEFGKQAGVQVQVERINQNDIQARVTPAVQAQTGADIIIIANNHALLYETVLADVSDVAEEIARRQGGWYDYATVNTVAGGRRKATEALSKFILVDMFARSLQGATPEDAVKWAAAELRKVYGA